MAESGLSVGFPELVGEVGKFLGHGYKTYTSYTAGQQLIINRIIQGGVRRVYYPPAVIAEAIGYEWTWLRPTKTLSIESGVSDYDLPDDFGRLVGTIHYPAEEYRDDIVMVSISKLLQLRSGYNLTGAPTKAAVRYKESTGINGQRQEILFYPEPDDDWDMLYEYEAYSGPLSESYPYPLGGMQLAELYTESCLALAESRINDEIGQHAEQFKALLIDAIARDKKRTARNYGNVGQPPEASDVEFRRGWTGGTYQITYKGEQI